MGIVTLPLAIMLVLILIRKAIGALRGGAFWSSAAEGIGSVIAVLAIIMLITLIIVIALFCLL